MRKRGYTFLELVLAAGASAVLMAAMFGLFARVFDMNRQLSRDQTWYKDDQTVMNAMSYMSRKIQRSIPSSIVSSDLSSTQFKFTMLRPSSDGTTFQSNDGICVVPCDGTVGYKTDNVKFRYDATGDFLEETMTATNASTIFPYSFSTSTSVQKIAFTSRPSVSLTNFTFYYATESSLPHSGSASDGFSAFSSANLPYYTGIRMQATLSFPDRAAKTYTKYVSFAHNPGFTRFQDRPSQYTLCGATAYNLDFYNTGGYNGSSYLDTVQRWRFSTNSWNTNPAPMGTLPAGVRCCQGVASAQKGNVNDRIYQAGGYNGASYLTYFDWFNWNTSTWTITNNLSLGRTNVSSVWTTATGCDGRIYSIGGYNSGTGYTRVVDYYDVCTATYGRADIPGGLGVPGSSPVLAAYGSYIYAFGGNQNPTQVLRLNPSTGGWSNFATLPYGIYDGVAVVMNASGTTDFIYLIGNGTISDRFLSFEPNSGTTNIVLANRTDTGVAVGAEVHPYYDKLYYLQETTKNFYGIELVNPYP